LLICDFVQMARNVLGLEAVPKLLFQHNVESQIYRRMADNETNWLKQRFIRSQQFKMEVFERDAGKSFQGVIAVSEQDKSIFAREYGWDHVSVIDTAVDTDYFKPMNLSQIPGRLAFVGSMDWLPNQEGVLRFVNRVFPAIRQLRPDATLDVVGRSPPPSIKRLGQLPGVTVTGSVDDVRPYIAQAEVAVVPLYAGGGTRLKIFEFMAMGTPVVSTTIGAEGLDLEDGKHWLCADSDEDFAQTVNGLILDASLRHRLSDAARELVLARFTSQAVARQFERVCQHVAGAPRSAPP
jgi:polysaccharide biosynthesis protein PslH